MMRGSRDSETPSCAGCVFHEEVGVQRLWAGLDAEKVSVQLGGGGTELRPENVISTDRVTAVASEDKRRAQRRSE